LKKNILIVGGTGFIGYHLVKRCLKKNFKVSCISTSKPDSKYKFKKVNYIICDIRNKKKLKKKIKEQFNYVVNLGGYVDHSKIKKTFTSHYNGCINLAELFKTKKIECFIQLGSGLEYGKNNSPQKENLKCFPQSIYGLAKYKSSKYLLNLYKVYNFPCTIIRLYQAYGPYQKFNRLVPLVIKSCLNDESFPCTSGIQKRDFLYIDDFINLIFKIFKNKKIRGHIINAGSGKPIKVKQLIELIKKYSKFGKPHYGKIKMRKDEILNMYPSIYKAQKILKWRPKISIQKGIKKTIKSYSEKF
jgi:UDP-glucose 4-epimerase